MNDRDRDPFFEDEDALDAPPPATWAGRRGRPEEDEEAGESGLTEEFDAFGDEFDAEFEEGADEPHGEYDDEPADLDDAGEDEEPYAEAGAEDEEPEWEDDFSADELEVPPDEFEFAEDDVEYEGELEVDEEFATGEHEAAVAPGDPDAGGELAADDAQAAAAAPATEAHDVLGEADEGAPASTDAPDADSPAGEGGDASDGGEDAPALAGAAAGAVASQETVEVDTLAIADEEEAREKAHAALAARAAERTQGHAAVGAPPPAAPAPDLTPASEPEPDAEELGRPPKRRLWLRFVAGSFVIIAAMAVATSVSLLVYLTDIAAGLGDNDSLGNVESELEKAGGGDPQTILVLGSDSREDPEQRNKNKGIQDARSDTTMLLRIDPDNDAIRLLSLPRDLKVRIPGLGGAEEKLNAAYSYGGPELTLKTVQRLLPDIEINHIVNVDFEGFYDAVNAIGCVYVDVDRHYYNPVGGEYDDIDIEAGYNKLCGYRALDYVRYRHTDNDLVRGARQQDFLREARQRIPPSKLISDRNELIGIFTKYTTSDIDDPITLLEVLKTIVAARNANVRQIDFQGGVGETYVESTAEQLEQMTKEFLADKPDVEEPSGGGKKGKKKGKKKKKQPKPENQGAPQAPEMWDVTGLSVPFAEQFDRYMRKKRANFPVYYPTVMVPGSSVTNESRSYGVPDFNDEHIYRGYKFVMPYQEGGFVSYYGVTGVNWQDPPILNNPSETRRIDGRDYLLFYDGDRLRLVGWKTKHGSYWVINTLTRALSEEQMLAIATSAKKF